MQVFTFFLCQPDGSAASFEAHPFATDLDAIARSRVLLGDHPSAEIVSVWDGERSVHEERRCDLFRAAPGFPRGQPRAICAQCAAPDCAAAAGQEH